jgi:GPH family glycoside/pentoside/hexuronide:cation symporter
MSFPSPAVPARDPEQDGSRREIIYYALGSVEGNFSGVFFNTVSTIMIVALGMDPLLLGFILAIRTFWDGFIDPTIAQLSDKTRSRWGRRRPFVLVGGIGRVLLLLAIFLFFPRDESIRTNAELSIAKEPVATAPATPPEVAATAATPPAPAATAAIEPSADTAAANAVPAVLKPEKPGLIESVRLGIDAFFAADNAYHRKVALYLLIACLLFATISSVNDVAYYALGIELCPSYDGRTRVVTYRAVAQKITSLFSSWLLPFCLLPFFTTVLDGLTWYAVFCIAIGVPTTLLMVKNTRERTITTKKKSPPLFKAIWQTMRNRHFLKVLGLYQVIGISNGIFTQVSLLLTIYWVYHGNARDGSILSGYIGSLGIVLAFASLPLVNWACRRLQKHRALRFAVLWMSIGTALKWILVTPENPYLQFILPFFFSIGISSVYTILPTMMADVTDIDELRYGFRREGMFGAVMSLLSKMLGSIQPILAGLVLKIAGFDPLLAADQPDQVILRMRLMFSLIPASLLLIALFLLLRYPLTREYMAEVKAKLLANRAAARAAQ